MKDGLFKIGEVTKAVGLTRRIIINYETMGILTPAYRDEQSGFRYYSADNIVHIRLIRALQNFGLSLEEIKRYFHDSAYLSKEIDRLVLLRNQLDQYIAQLRLRQTNSENAEIIKVTLPEFSAYCIDYSGLDLSQKTAMLRQTYIDAVKKYPIDHENKMCTSVPIDRENVGTFIIPVLKKCRGKNIRTFPQTTAVCIYYRGPYENFPSVHRRLLDYAKEHKMTPNGYFRNIYMEGPPTHGDDKNSYITQIALPIKFV